MSVVVTLHVFSGRPDPAWELTENQAVELAEHLRSINKTTLLKPPGIVGSLGYRGFSINSVREKDFAPMMYIHAGVVDRARFGANLLADDTELERWLLSTAGQSIDETLNKYVNQELSSSNLSDSLSNAVTLDMPPYDSGKWNDDIEILINNNCYNYANNKITNTYAQPGRGSGRVYTVYACGTDDDDVASASIRDGQIPIDPPSGIPAQGHFIALVLWGNNDYHWYRQDSNGIWSHKQASTPVKNVDDSNNPIIDPRTCDRGPYNDFCGFFHCIPANTHIL
jgi:hypothetical protein